MKLLNPHQFDQISPPVALTTDGLCMTPALEKQGCLVAASASVTLFQGGSRKTEPRTQTHSAYVHYYTSPNRDDCKDRSDLP